MMIDRQRAASGSPTVDGRVRSFDAACGELFRWTEILVGV